MRVRMGEKGKVRVKVKFFSDREEKGRKKKNIKRQVHEKEIKQRNTGKRQYHEIGDNAMK